MAISFNVLLILDDFTWYKVIAYIFIYSHIEKYILFSKSREWGMLMLFLRWD